MAKKPSIQTKYVLIFLGTLALLAGFFFVGLFQLRTEVARNEAAAVADQVVSFRAWVARTGMIWVDRLAPEFQEFLASRDDGQGGEIYGKNPALATRELSILANATASRATFRVTSDEYRHPDNAPDEFESQAIRAFKKNRQLGYFESYDKGSYRYARPIFVKKTCLKCHGDPEDAPKEVLEKYGSEKAFGYKEGDIRGIISVRLPAISLGAVLSSLLNPISIVLLVLAFVLNFYFTYRFIIRRLVRLTDEAEAIAGGRLGTPLDYTPPDASNDEIDHLYHAVNLLKKSLNIAIRKIKGKR